jgi:opacity protein-like surface antigen
MKKTTTFALAALAAVAFTGTAKAQASLPLSFEGRVGAVIPTGDWGDLAKTGYGLNGNVTFNVTPIIGIYGGYTWNRFDVSDDLGGDVGDAKFTEQGFDVGLKARFASPAGGLPLTPFFRAGAIFHKIKLSDDDASISGDTKIGFDVGGGAEIAVSPRISLTPQVGYSQFNPGDDEDVDSEDSIDVSNVHVGVGINIRL